MKNSVCILFITVFMISDTAIAGFGDLLKSAEKALTEATSTQKSNEKKETTEKEKKEESEKAKAEETEKAKAEEVEKAKAEEAKKAEAKKIEDDELKKNAGWKDLKWGMTYRYIKEFYRGENEKECFAIGGEKATCDDLLNVLVELISENRILEKTFKNLSCKEEEPAFSYKNAQVALPNIKEATCKFKVKFKISGNAKELESDSDWQSTGIYLLNDKIFGKKVDIHNVYVTSDSGPDKQMNQLKEFLEVLKQKYPGRIEYRETKNFRGDVFKFPFFKYKSDDLLIFNIQNGYLYFYDPRALKLIIDDLDKEMRETTKEEKENMKQLF